MKKNKNISLFLCIISFFYIISEIINEKLIMQFQNLNTYIIINTITYLILHFPIIIYFIKYKSKNYLLVKDCKIEIRKILFYWGLIAFINVVVGNIIIFQDIPKNSIVYNYENTIIYVVRNIILGVFIAPILEEIIFRGILMNSLMKYGYKLAIIINSVLFGFYHIDINVVGRAILTGVVFSYIAYKYSLKYSIILHTLINAMANFSRYSDYIGYTTGVVIGMFFVFLLLFFIIGIIKGEYKGIFLIFKLNIEDRKNIITFLKTNVLYLLIIFMIVISNLLFNYKLF